MNDKKPPTQQNRKQQKRADALRENLLKRKQQTRARAEDEKESK